MIKRIGVMIGSILIAGGLWSVPPADGQTEPMDTASQEQAATAVMEQLDAADGELAMAEIDGLDELGPPPWLSLTPDRSEEVVEAWLEVAAQLPPGDLVARHRARRPGRPIRFTESEAPGQTGANDTPDTGEPIRRLGTRRAESRRAIIDGDLSGAPEGFPVILDCPSVEDDGAIPLANDPGPDVALGVLCGGVIGDGPYGESSGDTDFYSLGSAEVGALLIVDVFNISDSLRPADTIVGIYDAAGNLVASAEDDGDPVGGELLQFEVTEPGDYYVGIAGCCELQSNPFDPASGPGVNEIGTYEVILIAFPPPPEPCLSMEDDGEIPLANETEPNGFGDDVLFVTECLGVIGDGPQAASGDVDFYVTRQMTEGKVLVVDLFDFDPDSVAGDFTIGVYDPAGTLLASGQDDPDPTDTEFFQFTVPTTGPYYVVIAGGLPTDPFDSTTGTDNDLVGPYDVFIVDITQELLDEITGEPGDLDWTARAEAASPAAAGSTPDAWDLLATRRAEATAEAAAAEQEPVVDTDVFLVELRAGDVISGGFDAARVTGILDPAGVGRMASGVNPSFIYPAESPLRHGRRIGFDHVVTTSGIHAVFVSEGNGPYQGELRVARAGRADERSRAQQIIFLDFDGALVSPDIFAPPGAPSIPAQDLSPLSAFLDAWGLAPDDEDAVIDAVIDSVIENLDTDLRVLDGRNGDRDATRRPTQFDIEILNSRDHGEQWGRRNVSRIVIGGTIEELQIATIGIAQSIDPGNLEAEETGVVLLDVLSGPAEFGTVSLNFYQLAGGRTKAEFVGNALGHVAAHEVGHYIGNWHTDTFNPVVSLMDAGGEWESLFGTGPDAIYGTADDVDSDFAEDVFAVFEFFAGLEDTAGRSVYGLSTGRLAPRRPHRPADLVDPAVVLAPAP